MWPRLPCRDPVNRQRSRGDREEFIDCHVAHCIVRYWFSFVKHSAFIHHFAEYYKFISIVLCLRSVGVLFSL